METESMERVSRGSPDGGGIRVLYVDDERDMTTVMSGLLEAEDEALSVATETNPEEALERLSHEHFDCVVSDFRMPEMDGVELLESIREREPDLPFLLFTGQGSEEVAAEAISAGVTDYLRKEGGTDEYPLLAQQIRAAVERRRAIERFEGFLESAPDAILVVDRDGTIEETNTQAEGMFGYDEDELVGEPVEVLLPERFRETHVAQRERYVADPETRPMGADVDLYGVRKDGTEFPVDVALSPVAVGGDVEVMAAVRDISTRKWREEELRERERQLERQNERLDEFASVVSHDLRNPLTVASGSVELARKTGDIDHLDEADRALERMERLLDDLLMLAREGIAVEELRPVSFSDVAERAWATVGTGAATVSLPDDGPDLRADRGRLRQVLENLLHNSIEHGRPDGPGDGHAGDADADDGPAAGAAADRDVAPISIEVGRLEDGFYVEDDGVGIDGADRTAIFEYGHSTTEEGTGFGLAIVQTIVQAHGWEIDVVAGASGGARFEVTGVQWV